MFACLVLYDSAMATPFYEVTDQEESPFNDAFYKNVIQQNEQESNTDQDVGQDDKEGQPTAVVQYNPRGDILLYTSCHAILGQEK